MGRFSLKRLATVLIRPAADEVHRVTEPDAQWQAWAAEHGFDYQFDGSAFEGGGYFEAPADRYGVGEQCYGVVRGTWNGQPFTYFARRTWAALGGRQSRLPGRAGALLIELPGRPRPDLLARSPAEAFRAAGGELPRAGTFEWRPPNLLFGHGHWLEPAIVEGILQHITLQLSVAPPELWDR
jgi:hypothetical protein